MIIAGFFCLGSVLSALSQTQGAYGNVDNKSISLLDPSRFSIHNMVSFGASAASGSSLQSQGLYNTMMTYQFAQPVTVRLNFGLPIYSTYSTAQNLTADNISSADYFKNMPLDFSVSWKPTQNFMMNISMIRNPQPTMFGSSGFFNDFLMPARR